MYGLHVNAIQEPTVVECAVGGSFSESGKGQVLVNRQNSLQLWETTSGDLSAINDLPVHEFVQNITRITIPGREFDAFLVFTSDDTVSLCAWNGNMFTWGGGERSEGNSTFRKVAVSLGLDENMRPKARRVDGIAVSGASPARRVSGVENETWKTFVATETYYGWLHIIQVTWEEDVGWMLDVKVKEIEADDSATSVLDLEFARDSIGTLGEQLGVLFVDGNVHEKIVSLSIFSCAKQCELSFRMSVRNVDPTTTLLMTIPEDCSFGDRGPLKNCRSGFLMMGSRTVSLLSFSFGADIEDIALFQWTLAGIATCGEFIGKGRWVIGDSSGGLTLVSVGNEASWHPISTQSLPSVPSSLAFAPEPFENLSGLLFVGSRIGNSQVLAVPLSKENDVPIALGSEVRWTMTQSTAIDNIGPINDMITVEGLPGIAEQQMLICSGRYPCGSLRRACLSMGVEAVITDGPVVQDGVRLFAVEARTSDASDSYLCFSYEAASRTDVMSMADTHFKPVRLPGFNHKSSSILVKMVPCDCLVQVTPQGIRAIGDCSGDSVAWEAPGLVSLAGVHEDAVVLAIGADLLSLRVSSKGVTLVSERKMPQQISGIYVAPLTSGQPYVVVGQWVSNTIHILLLTSLQHCCKAELTGFQPRSFGFLAVRDLGQCLLVGTGSGTVGVLELFNKTDGSLFFGDSRMVEVGTVGVEVCNAAGLMADSDCVVATCEHVAIFCIRPFSLSLLDGVEPVRLHLGQGCRALACISSKAIARGLAWVSSHNQLMFGSLCPTPKLRWMSAMIGETPLSGAYHSQSGCFVVLTEGAMGVQCLRLVDANTLRPPLPGMQLDTSHSHCGVLVARLPCSSNMQLEEDGWKETQEPWKEFVVLWSYITVREGTGDHSEASQGLISFFEIVSLMAAGCVKLELRLHGSCALSTVPHSCVVINQCLGSTDPFDEEGQEEDDQEGQKDIVMQVTDVGSTELHWGQNWPIVLVGGQLDVTAHRFFVDDASILGVKVVADLIKGVPNTFYGSGEEVPQRMADSTRWDRLFVEELAEESGEGTLIEAAKRALRTNWRQGVISKTVGSAAMGSPVVSLTEIDGMVVALEFLGSLTVFRNFVVKMGGQRSPLWTPLIPLSADRSSLSVQAVIPLTKSMFLVSVHPFGFVVLHHDGETTKEQVRLWREHVLQNFEGGRHGRARPDGGAGGMEVQDNGLEEGGEGTALTYLFHSAHNLNSLMVGASCRVPQVVGGFCYADLGMKLGRIGSDVNPSTTLQGHDEPSVLYFTAGGMVGLCRVIPAEDGDKLASFQKSLQSRQAAGEFPMVSGHNHNVMFDFLDNRGEQAGVCLDGNFINRGLNLEEGSGRDFVELWHLNNPHTSRL